MAGLIPTHALDFTAVGGGFLLPYIAKRQCA
jgi:hypothetical protein